jgi:hypothetical protein
VAMVVAFAQMASTTAVNDGLAKSIAM